ncbi:MAG: acyl-CoA thioesterase [Planctomycetes bacterium]|nr:acyl-CoA thioesterase [Planctomycetota bacterium]
MVHVTTTRVRYEETDQMGVVYHANYLIYFELGRTEMMRAAGVPYAELEKRGTLLAVTRAEAQYVASARYDDLLRIETTLDQVRKASIGIAYEVYRDVDDVLLARGRTELAAITPEGRPKRLEPEIARLLELAGD